MKTGYSLLLGEYVGASEIDHADTIGFQVVCPECKDALFKVHRETPKGTSEFLSHHKAPKEIAADCELRVASISLSQQASTNAQSRGQTLRAFRSVLAEAMLLDYTGAEHLADKFTHARALSESGGRRLLFQRWRETHFARKILLDEFDRGVGKFQQLYPGHEFDTSFSRSIQQRIARDMLEHLSTPHATKNQNVLIATALLQTEILLEVMAMPDPTKSEEYVRIAGEVLDICRAAMDPSPARFQGHFAKWAKDVNAPSRFNTFEDFMHRHAVGLLMRLPYKEMLANHRGGRHMMEGIAPLNAFLGMRVKDDRNPSPSMG